MIPHAFSVQTISNKICSSARCKFCFSQKSKASFCVISLHLCLFVCVKCLNTDICIYVYKYYICISRDKWHYVSLCVHFVKDSEAQKPLMWPKIYNKERPQWSKPEFNDRCTGKDKRLEKWYPLPTSFKTRAQLCFSKKSFLICSDNAIYTLDSVILTSVVNIANLVVPEQFH